MRTVDVCVVTVEAGDGLDGQEAIMTMYHCTIDLDYILRQPRSEAGRILKRPDGTPLKAEEVYAEAAILKARGFETMPVGCDHYDARGHCLGHAKID